MLHDLFNILALAQPTADARPTQHAMLIIWGHFAHSIGLLDRLNAIPVTQKSVTHTPQAKLTAFLIGLLSGIEHLSDLNAGPAPLVRDHEVATAWGLPGLADASGVSRTLVACDAQTLLALQAALEATGQPYLNRAVSDLRERGQPLLLDVDLTGRPVSDTSRTFPDAAFGYMDGQIRLGYQVAEICLHTELFGRQWLVGEQHPGDTVSAPCLLPLLQEAERRLGCHPRRRTELLDVRIAAIQETVAAWEAQANRYAAQTATLRVRREGVLQRLRAAFHAVYDLQARPTSTRQSGPYGVLTKTKQRLARYERRWHRTATQLTQLTRMEQRYRAMIRSELSTMPHLQARRDSLAAQNAAQPDAPRCIVRMDAGFSSGENLTALLELGYEIETKSANAGLVNSLLGRVTSQTEWVRVGKNAQMVGWINYRLASCPYPLTVGLERFHTPAGVKHAVLLRSQEHQEGQEHANPNPDDSTACLDLCEWFRAYNGRQNIEAGIKQEKTVFKIQHLMSRSEQGTQIQMLLTLFAANFVSWAGEWVRERMTTITAITAVSAMAKTATNRRFKAFKAMQGSTKQLVRVAANSPGTVEHTDGQVVVRFSSLSSLGGVVVWLVGAPAVQLALPLLPMLPSVTANAHFSTA